MSNMEEEYLPALKMYMNDIGDVDLLTKEEEIELARKIQNGDLNAFETFVKKNLYLVINIAKQYIGKGLPIMDIIGEGNIGLIEAVQRFDYTKDYRFSTYATILINKYIRKALSSQAHFFPYNRYEYKQISNMKKALNELSINLQREPTEEELAKKLNKPIEKVRELEIALLPPYYLDQKIKEDEDITFKDMLPYYEDFTKCYRIDGIKELKKMLLYSNLSPRELEIFLLYFNLEKDTSLNYTEISEIFGVTRQRIYQIMTAVKAKLKNNYYVKELHRNNEADLNVEKEYIRYRKINDLMSIYKYFESKNYVKEEIDEMLTKLPQVVQKIIFLRESIINNTKDDLKAKKWVLKYSNIYYLKILPCCEKILLLEREKCNNLKKKRIK